MCPYSVTVTVRGIEPNDVVIIVAISDGNANDHDGDNRKNTNSEDHPIIPCDHVTQEEDEEEEEGNLQKPHFYHATSFNSQAQEETV